MKEYAPLSSLLRASSSTAAFAALALAAASLTAAEPSDSAAEIPLRPGKEEYWSSVQTVLGDEGLRRGGAWEEAIYRQSYPARRHLHTEEDGAWLEREIETSGDATDLVLVLESHPAYVYRGGPVSGLLEVTIEGASERVLDLRSEAAEVVLARALPRGKHRVRLRHRAAPDGGRGARVVGFRSLPGPTAELAFVLGGEEAGMLVDARFTLRSGGEALRSSVQRNWLSGAVRLAGLPPAEDAVLEIEAAGWEPLSIDLPPLHPGSERRLVPLHLRLDRDLLSEGVASPRLGHPAVKSPGEGLRIEFAALAERAEIAGDGNEALQETALAVRWVQQIGPARRSVLLWEGEQALDPAAHAAPGGNALEFELPPDPYDGFGDLVVETRSSAGPRLRRSPRSLRLRPEPVGQPLFLVLGHLDTWGHYQAETLAAFAGMTNLIDPDAVLLSNEVNPAYVAGGLKGLQAPHLATIGNHAFGYETSPSYLDASGEPAEGRPGRPYSVSFGETAQGLLHREPHYEWRRSASRAFDRWYGDPVGAVDLGGGVAVLNYGWSWEPERNREAIALAAERFEPFRGSRVRVLNAYESEPPSDFLDHFDFALVHSAHAWPRAVAKHAPDRDSARGTRFWRDETLFLGKRSSDTFRLVRFEADRAGSHSYAGHEHDPYPFDRHRAAPLRAEFEPAPASGPWRARVVNQFREPFPGCRLDWVLPRGEYTVAGAELRGAWDSDDARWTVLTLRLDVPAEGARALEATAQ